MSVAKAWQRALARTAPIARQPLRALPVVVAECAERFVDASALVSEGEQLSYRALDARANQYARWALAHGVSRGSTVCLLMPNRPEYVAIWLGITRAGGAVALLNTNLRGESLARCAAAAAPRHIIADAALAPAIERSIGARLWVHGVPAEDHARIDLDVSQRSGERLGEHETQAPTVDDRALLIYTSGTTGLPKAANISHARIMQWSLWFAGMLDCGPQDRMYNVLPMYHSVGGVLAIAPLLVGGGAIVIREGFSARRFWQDVVRWDCTLVQYIGELCRYLLNSAPTAEESRHRLRMACGNGLRAEVWRE